MDNKQSIKWSMLVSVKTFYQQNSTIFNPLPQFPPIINEISDLIQAMTEQSAITIADFSGFTEQKNDVRLALEEICVKVSSGLVGYWVVNPQPDTIETDDYLPSYLQLSSDSELYVLAVLLYRVAQPVQGSLLPYGVTAAEVGDLNTVAEKFLLQIKRPRNQQRIKSRAIKKLKELFGQADAVLEKSDIYLKPFQFSNTNLWSRYQSARALVNRPATHTVHTKRGKVLPGFVAHAPFAPEVLTEKVNLILTNTAKGTDIQFYFAANALEKPTAQTILTSVSFRKPVTIASVQAGYTTRTPHLNILNPGASIRRWKAEVVKR